jgi:hypothetical protein
MLPEAEFSSTGAKSFSKQLSLATSLFFCDLILDIKARLLKILFIYFTNHAVDDCYAIQHIEQFNILMTQNDWGVCSLR